MNWFDIIKVVRRPRVPSYKPAYVPPSQEEVMDEEKHKTLGDYELPETEKEWDSLENRITRSTWFRQTDKQKKKMIDFFKRKILRRPRDR